MAVIETSFPTSDAYRSGSGLTNSTLRSCRARDELRRREFPPLTGLHADVALLAETVKQLPNERISVAAAIMAVIAALLGGFLIGKAFQ
jgi:hypothetical protein